MTDLIPYAITAACSLAAGGFAVHWIKSRRYSSKAEALKFLAMEAALVGRMQGAAEEVAIAQAKVQAEALAAQQAAAALAKVSGATGA